MHLICAATYYQQANLPKIITCIAKFSSNLCEFQDMDLRETIGNAKVYIMHFLFEDNRFFRR